MDIYGKRSGLRWHTDISSSGLESLTSPLRGRIFCFQDRFKCDDYSSRTQRAPPPEKQEMSEKTVLFLGENVITLASLGPQIYRLVW